MVSKHRVVSGVLYKHARDQLRALICMTIWRQQKQVSLGCLVKKRNIRLNSNIRIGRSNRGATHTHLAVYVTLPLVLPRGGGGNYDAIRHATTSEHATLDRVSQANDRVTSLLIRKTKILLFIPSRITCIQYG